MSVGQEGSPTYLEACHCNLGILDGYHWRSRLSVSKAPFRTFLDSQDSRPNTKTNIPPALCPLPHSSLTCLLNSQPSTTASLRFSSVSGPGPPASDIFCIRCGTQHYCTVLPTSTRYRRRTLHTHHPPCTISSIPPRFLAHPVLVIVIVIVVSDGHCHA